jgi:hypothetical protein
MSLYQCILGTPQWLGRCSQLESSAARCLINDFPAFHGRQNDQVTVRWQSKRCWQTYRHTWSISFEFSLSLWRSTPCYEMLFSQSICLYVCLCVRQSACRSVMLARFTMCACSTVFSCLHSFHPVYREVVAIHVCLHQAVGTDGPPLFPDCLNAIYSSRVVRFPRYLCLCTRPSVPMLCLGVPSAWNFIQRKGL